MAQGWDEDMARRHRPHRLHHDRFVAPVLLIERKKEKPFKKPDVHKLKNTT